MSFIYIGARRLFRAASHSIACATTALFLWGFPLGQGAQAKDLFRLDAVLDLQSGLPRLRGANALAPASPITSYVSGGRQFASVSFNDITSLANSLSNTNLQTYLNLYTPTSAVSTTLYIRGLGATASYAANSTALRFGVPSVGIDLTFNGATRNESQTQFKDFLLKNGGDILSRMLRALVAESPVDPVAGNPNSLQAQMNATSFSSATGFGSLGSLPTRKSDTSDRPTMPNMFTVGGDLGAARSGGYTSTAVHLPLKYAVHFDDPGYALIFDLPLTYVRTEGAQSGLGSFGTALRIPLISDAWYLTPSIRAGAAGSIDLGAAALMYSADLTSLYTFHVDDLRIGIGNGIGFYKSGGFSVRGYSFDYKLRNTIVKNGISIEGSLDAALFDRPTSWQAYVTDTYAFGDRLYVQRYNEVGLVMGTRQTDDGQVWDSFRLGVTYTVGRQYNALKANVGYRF